MAFNPFANFRKYQKIWMASILLVTMVTFVLCTGTRGDFMEWVLLLFRSKGPEVVRIDGKSIRQAELSDLKTRRNIANEFMNKGRMKIIEKIDDELKPENLKKLEAKFTNAADREKYIQRAHFLRQHFEMASKERRFFGTGVKLDDLINHKLWLMEADRLNVDLNDEAVLILIEASLGRGYFTMDVFNDAWVGVRANHQNVTRSTLMQCLRDEFRARCAQKALNEAGDPRLALTPDQLWDFYKEKRSEFSVSLLPLYVEDFAKKMPQPSESELQSFFDANRTNPFDPTSDKIGFALPPRVKVAWISADPKSDHYKRAARLAIELEGVAPLVPLQLGPLQVASSLVAKSAAADTQFDVSPALRSRYISTSLVDAGSQLAIVDFLLRKDAVSAAGMIGAALRADAHPLLGALAVPTRYAYGLVKHAREFEIAAREDAKARVPFYATLALMGTAHAGLAIPPTWYDLEDRTQYLPRSVVRDELAEVIEQSLAIRWVQANMQLLKRKLEEPNVTTALAIERVLKNYAKDMGLQRNETKELYHRYNIEEAKELEPLYKAYLAKFEEINFMEGRSATPEAALKSDSFWRLFFDGSLSYSASGGRYHVKPWPPVVSVPSLQAQQARLMPEHPRFGNMARLLGGQDASGAHKIDLFKDATRPFLFWKTADEGAMQPDKLDPIKDRVVELWKFNRAREKEVVPRAKKIAEELQNGNIAYFIALNDQVEKLRKEADYKRDVIPLPQVAPLRPLFGGFGQQRLYQEFELPAGLIPLQRPETAKMILSLYDLKKPFETGNKELDDINKRLFDEMSKAKNPQGKFVQIITNKSRSVYYVAAVRDQPFASFLEFRIAFQEAFGRDQLFDHAQADAYKRLRESLVEQLRSQHDVEVTDAEARKTFDSDVGG